MRDIVLGLLALVAGVAFLARGYLALRIVIPIWGFFTGFALGAGAVAAFTGDGFLADATAWAVGFAFGLLFASIAYLYYAVMVVLTMASLGFSFGAGVMVALDVEWTWLIVLVGVLTGLLVGVVSVVGDLPLVVLVFATSFAGAAAVVVGAMLMVGAIDSADFTTHEVVSRIEDSWFWYLGFLVLLFGGVAAQVRHADDVRASMRSAWPAADDSGSPA